MSAATQSRVDEILDADGGPAFPAFFPPATPHTPPTSWSGMTLRDYFMAHEPEVPQQWFTPVLPPRPQRPAGLPSDLTKGESEEVQGWRDWLSTSDLTEERVREWATRMDSFEVADEQWAVEREKQRLVQWPAAWADEQLRQSRGTA